MAELQELIERIQTLSGIKVPDSVSLHLGVFTEPYLSRMLLLEKTVESRITKNRVAPYGHIHEGDVVLVKRTGGRIEAVFTAGKAREFELASTPLSLIRERYGDSIRADDSFWREKAGCRYAVLIEIRKLTLIYPISIEKRDRRTWVVLRERRRPG